VRQLCGTAPHSCHNLLISNNGFIYKELKKPVENISVTSLPAAVI